MRPAIEEEKGKRGKKREQEDLKSGRGVSFKDGQWPVVSHLDFSAAGEGNANSLFDGLQAPKERCRWGRVK